MQDFGEHQADDVYDDGAAGAQRRQGRGGEEGSALIFSIVLTVSVAALVMAHLGEVHSEKRKVSSILASQRATERAVGALERARNIVNSAPYVRGKNTALWAAIHSDPPYVPGTEVRVERIGASDSEWFTLRAQGNYQQYSKLAQVFVRERSPITNYNLFVQDHPVGISGTPKGQIHTNKSLEFMFPFGTYTDSVSASEGYKFVADATPENTRIWGPSNPAAAPLGGVLSSMQFPELRDQADTLRVTDDLLAEITFLGKTTKVDLFTPQSRVLVPRTGTRRVFDGWDTVTRKRKIMEFVDVSYRIKIPVYSEVTEHVTQKQAKYSWHAMTRARREAIYEDRVEHYYENEEIWGTKFVARTTYEADFVQGGAAATALAQVSKLAETIPSLIALDAKVFGVRFDLELETDCVNDAIRALKRDAPGYDVALEAMAKILDDRTAKWAPSLKAADKKAAYAAFYDDVRQAETTITNERALGGSDVTDYGDLSQADVEKLGEIQSFGSQGGDGSGVYELRATHDYVEIPYVMSKKLVRKTRLKRIKKGERLVTFVEKTRRFSHNETRHALRKRRVYQGQMWVARTRRVPKGWKVISEDVQVPRYRTESYVYLEEVTVPRALLRSETVDTTGMIYIEREIEKLAGDVNGQVTVVSNGAMKLTGNICYVDDEGCRRMLHGDEPAEPFLVNPDYRGNSVLLLISRGDILYSKDLPQRFELNGTVVSVQGKCAMEGIEVSTSGTEISISEDATSNPALYVKESMRRLGGILAAKRPVSAYIDKDNNVLAGFREGVGLMDPQMVTGSGGTTIAPATPMFDRPTWTLRSVGKKIDLMQ